MKPIDPTFALAAVAVVVALVAIVAIASRGGSSGRHLYVVSRCRHDGSCDHECDGTGMLGASELVYVRHPNWWRLTQARAHNARLRSRLNEQSNQLATLQRQVDRLGERQDAHDQVTHTDPDHTHEGLQLAPHRHHNPASQRNFRWPSGRSALIGFLVGAVIGVILTTVFPVNWFHVVLPQANLTWGWQRFGVILATGAFVAPFAAYLFGRNVPLANHSEYTEENEGI